MASNLEDLDRYLSGFLANGDQWFPSDSDRVMGLDTEATSLDTRRAKLTGISVSLAKGTGIYIPTGHKIGQNVDAKEACVRIQRKLDEGYVTTGYNLKYDLNVLQANTGWYPKNYEDALELVYIANPDRLRKDLKLVCREDLNFNLDPFESLFTPEEVKAKTFDISTKAPGRCYTYACGDADGARRIWIHHRDSTRTEFDFAWKVDNALIEIVRRMEHNGGMELNEDYIQEQLTRLTARAEALRGQLERQTGTKFDPNSPKQLGIALFDRAGVPSPGMTKGKNPMHMTDADNLEKLATAYPVVETVISYRKVAKAAGTYLKKLQLLAELKQPVRFNFNIFAAPTWRFAAPGGDPRKDGSTGINIQAVSNGEARDMMSVDLQAKSADDPFAQELPEEDRLVTTPTAVVRAPTQTKTLEEILATLPYTVPQEEDHDHLYCFRETCAGCPARCADHGIDTTRRMHKNLLMIPSIRQAFRAPAGHMMVSFDYVSQELVIAANLSGEPKWVTALNNKEDLHQMTGAAAYGIQLDRFKAMEATAKGEYDRKRGIGKIMNFATLYGATAYTLAKKADIPQGQADAIFDGFWREYPTLHNWIQKVHIFSRKNGYTTSYFGRKRWLKQFYEMPDRKMHAFADRSAVNTAIQGTGAEVTRMAMVRVAKKLREAGLTPAEVRFCMQLHDELSFLIRDDVLERAIPVIIDGMELKVKSWPVQLSVSCKIGRVWGRQLENKKGKWTLREHLDKALKAA